MGQSSIGCGSKYKWPPSEEVQLPAYAYETVYLRGGEPRDPLYTGAMYLKGYFEVKGEWAVISVYVTV